MRSMTMQVAQRGQVTLPKELRDAYQLLPGDVMTVVDLGGTFLLSRGKSEAAELADQIANALTERGETLETMLAALREQRSVESDDAE